MTLLPTRYVTGVLAWTFLLLPATPVWADDISNPHAGYWLELPDAGAWTSELTNVRGITSSLCLQRQEPKLVLCLQSIHEPLPKEQAMEFAKGFVDGIADGLGVESPQDLVAHQFRELDGFGQEIRLASSAEFGDVWMFAGIGPQGQPQTAVAFSVSGEHDRARATVRAVIDSLRFDGDRR